MGEGEDAAPEADRPGATFEIQWEFASRQIAKELPTQDTRSEKSGYAPGGVQTVGSHCFERSS